MIGAIFLLLVILVVGVIRGQAALIMLSSLLLVTMGGSLLWSRRAPQLLTYRHWFEPPRIFPGEEAEYVVEIVNHKALPLPWVHVEEKMPAAVLPVVGGPHVTNDEAWQRRRTVSIAWNERLVLRQRFTSLTRGDYVIGPTEIETGDPLGFFPAHLHIEPTRELLVYPRFAELPPVELQSRFPFGPASARPPVLEDPARFAGIRDYQPGDPMKWVDWKASARRMKLQTRVFAPTTLQHIMVVLNVQTMAYAWQGYLLDRLDAAVAVAATLVRDAVEAQHSVGIAANASGVGMEDFQVFLPPNQRPTQLEDTLAVLAQLAPIPTMAFGTYLRRIAANFPYGASLAVVTSFLDDDTASDLARLMDRGHAVSLIFLGSELPVAVDRRLTTLLLPQVTFEPTGGSERDLPDAVVTDVRPLARPMVTADVRRARPWALHQARREKD
ncbi:MAG: hypothetical protein QOF51_3086 [Chloroflexota bacterium]|nr:hypothetical protein [Chloroflexota bacterium]